MTAVTNNKWKEVWSNPSAYITITVIVLGLLKTMGIDVDVTNDGNVDINDANVLVTGVWQKHLSDIAAFLVPILAGLMGKISKIQINKASLKEYVMTSNFITAVFSLVTLVLGVYLDAELVAVIVTTVANILNFIYHLNIPTTSNDNNSKPNQ